MNKNQTIFGIVIIIVAVLVLLSNINIGFARELVYDWWPLLIVGLGLYMMWNDRNNFAWGLIITGVGIGLLVNTLGVFGLSFGDVVVPIILLAVGAAVLMGATRSQTVRGEHSTESPEAIWAILGGVNSRNTSDDYHGGGVNAVLGGADLDLSQAVIKKDAVVQVWVLMGGVTLRVPKGVVVRQRTMNILGSTEDKTDEHKAAGAPVIYIDGTVTMGSVEIKN